MPRRSSPFFVALLSLLAPACGAAGDSADGESVSSATVASVPGGAPYIHLAMPQAFGAVTVGTTESYSFTASTYKAIPFFSMTGPNAADFSITTGTCSTNTVFETRACPVTITFAPTKGQSGSMSATLVATSSSAPQASMAVTGVAIPTTTKRIWVSATTNNGDFGSMATADALCMADANKPSNVVSAKAMLAGILSGSGASAVRTACVSAYCATGGASENVDWVLHPSTPYVRPDGTPIATTTSASIFPSTLTNGVSATDLGPVVAGLLANWTTMGGANCSSWTSASASARTLMVFPEDASLTAFSSPVGVACNTSNAVYCVEQ